MNKLVLFDVDSTLIKWFEGNPHALAFAEGVKKAYGIDTTAPDFYGHSGMTDRLILHKVLGKKGLNEETINSKIEECMKVMSSYFNKIFDKYEYTLLDGIKELLKELEKRDLLIGLVTGNLEPIARGKLEGVGINHFFKLGGFGNDIHTTRSELVNIAIKRAEKLGFKRNNNVFLVGDAVLDVKAGKEVNVVTIAVASGITSFEDLEKADADYILLDLKNTKMVLDIIIK